MNDSTSSPISVKGGRESYLHDHTSTNYQIGSTSGSFQNEGFLDGISSDSEFSFTRTGFRQTPLVGTVETYDRHVFLCYKNPQVWPPRIEASEFDRLPRLLSSTLASRKAQMKKTTRLTICEGHDGTETSNGDVLIFPDMIIYRRLTHFDVEMFVEEVLVKDGDWLPGIPESLRGFYVFVCAHGSRDQRCGVCGPPLIARFREDVELRGLQNKLSVSPCSHIGGHKYAGNVIIFGPTMDGNVTGHWYGYVTPDDVPLLLEHHIGKGEIVDYLWRGQMGLSEEDQKTAQETRLKQNGLASFGRSMNKSETGSTNSCCQTNGRRLYCCQNTSSQEKTNGSGRNNEKRTKTRSENDDNNKSTSKKRSSYSRKVFTRRICNMPTWFESWERDDTYATLSVVVAAVSVAFAYGYYKRMN
ncbi:uncharacterized protein LOC124938584 [Impatiens glandulifera]|uniref:uncharacterized protein LOC124938584 n=1 Tax=Impatiens glandulifera TaxID=253017 RepID=UPI001FB07AC4|nr:uncharacterized protein LOC124938584 [Impatiens glandulifera]